MKIGQTDRYESPEVDIETTHSIFDSLITMLRIVSCALCNWVHVSKEDCMPKWFPFFFLSLLVMLLITPYILSLGHIVCSCIVLKMLIQLYQTDGCNDGAKVRGQGEALIHDQAPPQQLPWQLNKGVSFQKGMPPLESIRCKGFKQWNYKTTSTMQAKKSVTSDSRVD